MFVFLPQKAEAGGVEGVCLSVLLEGLREVSAGLWSPGKQHFPKDSRFPETRSLHWGRCLGAMSGDVCGCHDWCRVGGARDAAQHSTVPQTARVSAGAGRGGTPP